MVSRPLWQALRACQKAPSLNPDPLRFPVMGVMRRTEQGGGDQRRVVGQAGFRDRKRDAKRPLVRIQSTFAL